MLLTTNNRKKKNELNHRKKGEPELPVIDENDFRIIRQITF